VLLVINGAPGVGKSMLADRFAAEHALALVVDIDSLRRRLGQWEAEDESKLVARELAVALTRDHLQRGRDVVVPQYFGRREFVERLRGAADEAGVAFVEVIVTDDADVIIERFRARRAELAAAGVRHPEADLADENVATSIRAADENLRAYAAANGIPLIEAAGDAYAVLAQLVQLG
jgi:predicted kinase